MNIPGMYLCGCLYARRPYQEPAGSCPCGLGGAGLLRGAVIVVVVFLGIPEGFLLKEHLLVFFYDNLLAPQLFAQSRHAFLKILILALEAMVLRDDPSSFLAECPCIIGACMFSESEQDISPYSLS